MPIPTPPDGLDELQIGDKVPAKRVLDHPPCDAAA